jgi:fructose-1,6-bisphosphatase/inositol monophosphatase family enzyme
VQRQRYQADATARATHQTPFYSISYALAINTVLEIGSVTDPVCQSNAG